MVNHISKGLKVNHGLTAKLCWSHEFTDVNRLSFSRLGARRVRQIHGHRRFANLGGAGAWSLAQPSYRSCANDDFSGAMVVGRDWWLPFDHVWMPREGAVVMAAFSSGYTSHIRGPSLTPKRLPKGERKFLQVQESPGHPVPSIATGI